MTDRLTDKVIIKALECCIKPTRDCVNCPYYKKEECFDTAKRDALNLIIRQQAKHDKLKNNYRETLTKQVELCDVIEKQQATIDVYMQENDKLKTAYIQVSEDRNEIRKETEAEIEAWKKINQRLYDEMEERRKEDIGIAKGHARIKAIKEFAERLKAVSHPHADTQVVFELQIDNLVKETVGEENDNR